MLNGMESVDIAALETLINDIAKFNNSMDNILAVMSRDVLTMQSYWDDPQYEQFKGFMDGLVKGLNNDLADMNATRVALQKIYDIMTT